ncbi:MULTISPECIES: hypothetical protein [Bradyrhizobium]|jgi:hypothetical protein|uniref:hypothetical protein n=1 Tax=Bradyrhizobium TaxID=374 RepID=UPI00048493EC|nr:MULTISPECIES: hypothetical protein [Bradyrhizobium]MCS3451088.1 hypothetical protein [Bradyrhizobium elkanii]MCS3557765.1 hypothetical protein [Bradyrhizobium elkanii]MCW2152387.1 hypothetical protein [Bradyrhizobium elkanii]MCW2357736.1 hypothetical protein [Bradyrhizobium elkanii]MCW2376117.1 hypothetical protein [Bradyrhizobium elkanii]
MWIVATAVELLVLFFVDLVGYNVARFVLPLLSFGRISVAPGMSNDQREFGWLGARRNGLGRVELGASAAGGIGLIICALCLAAVLFFVR